MHLQRFTQIGRSLRRRRPEPDATAAIWERVPIPTHPAMSVPPMDRDAVLAWVRDQVEEMTVDGVDDYTADLLDARVDDRVDGWDWQTRHLAEGERVRLGSALAEVEGLLNGVGADLARLRREVGLLERRHAAWDEVLTGEHTRVAARPPVTVAEDETPTMAGPVCGMEEAGAELLETMRRSMTAPVSDEPAYGRQVDADHRASDDAGADDPQEAELAVGEAVVDGPDPDDYWTERKSS